MLPTKKSVRISSRQSDRMKTSWLLYRDADCRAMDMSPFHPVWPKPSLKARWEGEEEEADRRRVGMTTSGNGQTWSLSSPKGQWRTENKWRKLVVKSSVVPKRPSRLKDRWGWWVKDEFIEELHFGEDLNHFFFTPSVMQGTYVWKKE